MLGSRSFYALWRGLVFEFACKRDRDYFLDNGSAIYISSKDAYKNYHCTNFIKVPSSCSLGANKGRKERIRKWYDNQRCDI